MKKLSNNKLLSTLTTLLVLALAAKLVNVVLLWFLPAASPQKSSVEIEQLPYNNFDFHALIKSEKKQKKVAKSLKKKTADITNMLLVGLYGNEKYGFAIVAMKKAPKKTTVVAVGEEYEGYKLARIFLNYILFIKENKEYILKLENQNRSVVLPSILEEEKEDIEKIKVTKNKISYYINNSAELWKDISIKVITRKGELFGFQVTNIRKGSKIATMGLQKDDIIIGINQRKIDTYEEIMDIYQHIYTIKKINLLILRNNKEKEIMYEIY